MPTITRTITTQVAVEDAFAYLADFSNASEWDPGTASSEPRGTGEPDIGSVYDLVVTFGSRTMAMTYEIVSIERNKIVVLEGDGSTTRAIDTITFSPTADDGTVVTYSAEIQLKGLLRLVEPFLGSKFKELGDNAERGLITALHDLEQRSR